ncbi:MAG: hypothetical protein FWC27_00825 [Firmicutes bacterium]|nr:hypothetical protein [Bacillota bacterium]
MKVKIISAMTGDAVENQVNYFLEMAGDDIQVQTIKFSVAMSLFAAMIIYSEVEK